MSDVPSQPGPGLTGDEAIDRRAAAARLKNQTAWDRMAAERNQFARPAAEKDLRDPLKTVDARGWLGGDIRGKHVLCLAAGGGKQSVIYAAAGARVSVVDISPAMLELDAKEARKLGYSIRIEATSMDRLSMFSNSEFDIVIQPVSTCYLPNIGDIYREVARVTKPNGIYVSQHKQPTSLQATLRANSAGRYELLSRIDEREPLPGTEPSVLRESGTDEFVHRWESLIGYMCRAGFVIEDLVEPRHERDGDRPGDFGHRAGYLPPYVRIKARRVATTKSEATPLWLPSAE